MRLVWLMLFCFFICKVFGQPKTDTLLQHILTLNTNDTLSKVLQQPQNYRLQIIYTQINRDKKNKPAFKNYYFNYDPDLYFNPASTVKLPLALLALEKLNKLNIKGVNKFTPVQFDSNYVGQTIEYSDSTSKNHFPSIAHFIKKAFLVSDNDAYNRLYEFTGQQTINRTLHKKGYENIRIIRQFKGFSEDQNRHTNQVRFINENGCPVFLQPAAYNTDSFYFPAEIKIGKAHLDNKDSLVNEPIDFTKANNVSLLDLQQLLQSALFPSSVVAKRRFSLTAEDYEFLYRYLSQYPSETSYPKYDTAKYYDSYVKFFFKNGSHQIAENIRVFNKVGWAYGFLTDASYIADFKNKIEFMLSATIYVNSDEILNDDKYDYDTTGYPFLYQLGQKLYNYELKRYRRYKPDLSKLNINYEHRNANDTRPAIKDVDN